MKRLRVLVIDDSALMRQLLSGILAADPELEVVGTAPDPIAARAKIEALRPDVLTLDVEMPRMDGLVFLDEIMRTRPMPVVMVSSLTERGCEVTLRALELGAVDFVTKPQLDVARGTVPLAREIITKVKNAARVHLRAAPVSPRERETRPEQLRPSSPPAASSFRTTDRFLAIGASTGGTEALKTLLMTLPADAPPVVVVQHMPPIFTRHFAERLDGLCKVSVREARSGDALLRGRVLIAPGGLEHLEIVRNGASYGVQLVAAAPVNHHRPSVDVLFHSCARSAGANASAAILTGMGGDGARGLLAMRHAGSMTIAEDESTCVVFGMPKEAIACGAACQVLPLDRIAGALLRASASVDASAQRSRSCR